MNCPDCKVPMEKVTIDILEYKNSIQELAHPYWKCHKCKIEIDIDKEDLTIKVTIKTKPNAIKVPIANKEGQLQVRHDGVLFDGELYLWEEITQVIIDTESRL